MSPLCSASVVNYCVIFRSPWFGCLCRPCSLHLSQQVIVQQLSSLWLHHSQLQHRKLSRQQPQTSRWQSWLLYAWQTLEAPPAQLRYWFFSFLMCYVFIILMEIGNWKNSIILSLTMWYIRFSFILRFMFYFCSKSGFCSEVQGIWSVLTV